MDDIHVARKLHTLVILWAHLGKHKKRRKRRPTYIAIFMATREGAESPLVFAELEKLESRGHPSRVKNRSLFLVLADGA